VQQAAGEPGGWGGFLRFSLCLFLLAGAAGGIFGEEAGVSGGPGGTPPGRTLSLDETLARLNLPRGETAALRWDPLFGTGVLRIAGRYVAFNTGKPGETGFILVDGRELISVSLPWLEKGLLLFPETLVGVLGGIAEAVAAEEQSRFRIAAIIVDPGHGGKDTGAIGNLTIDGKPLKVLEKDITLKVSKLLRNRLSAAYPDKRVFLTREGDTYPTLEDRVVIANSVTLQENEAIVFVSVHANASFNRHARGYEVWYLSPDYRRTVIDEKKYADSAEVIPILNAMMEEEFTTESIMIAQAITNRIAESMGKLIPSRGIKAEEWFVVRNTRMPSVLVELGFVTNEADARLLTDDTCLQNFSEALYKGIADFIATFERSGGFTALQ
jgi:N-acetylmuramoyl-L-alanine amidase